MKTVNFDTNSRGAFQGDLAIFRLSDNEAKNLSGRIVKRSETGDMRLLEGEVTGHHHTIVGKYTLDGAAKFNDAGLARDMAVGTLHGSAALHDDPALLGSLPWLQRTDLAIGFLKVEGGPVVLDHPEHDTIRLPEGTYYIGRQVESAGAEERVVAD